MESVEGSHQELAARLDQGKLDFALLHRPNPYPQFPFTRLRWEQILLAVRRDAPALAALPPALRYGSCLVLCALFAADLATCLLFGLNSGAGVGGGL